MQSHSTLISPAQLQAVLDQPNVRILDCRFDLMQPDAGRNAWLDAHIPGAQYADLDNDLAGPRTATSGRHPLPDAETFARRLGEWGIGHASRVIVYDSGSGAIAARAWWMMRWVGLDHVTLLDGGFTGWLDAGNPVDAGPVRVTPEEFKLGCVMDRRVLTTAEIVACQRRGEPLTLVDARDASRYRGEREPIDTIAGHIPGSLNRPFSENLDLGGRWKESAELAASWRQLLGDAPGPPWAVMCGSGVTACHLALSGLLAGYQEPRLYAGSWSEWITDPGRGVATGPDPR